MHDIVKQVGQITKTIAPELEKPKITIIGENDKLKAITYYDTNGKRVKTVDLSHPHNNLGIHTHHGYKHNENDNKKGATRNFIKMVTKGDRRKTIVFFFANF